MSIRLKVISIIISISLVIVAFGTSSGMISILSHLNSSIETDMTKIAEIADRLVSTELYLLKSNAERVTIYLVDAPEDQLEEILQEQANTQREFTSLTIFNREGIIAAYGPDPAPVELINDEYIRRTFNGISSVSTTRYDSQGNLFFHVYAPIGRDRVLAATVPGMFFNDLLSEFTIWQTGHIFIDDHEGYILANRRAEWVQERRNFIELAKTDSAYTEIAKMVSLMIRGETGVRRFFMDGVERLCAYRPISGSVSGWTLGVIAPIRESALTNVANGMIMTGVISVLLSIIAACFASGTIEKPYAAANNMLKTLEYQTRVLHTTNDAAAVLLQSDVDRFVDALHTCMDMFSHCVGVDRMRIWENSTVNGKLYCSQLYEWSEGAEPQQGKAITKNIPYSENIPGWEEKLSTGQCINGIVRTFSDAERGQLSPQGIISILVIPIYFREHFWGFVVYDDCHKERVFSIDEENLLRSGGLLIADAILRNQMTVDLVQAREAALSSNEAKSRFLANTSHEMRTPLNAIIGFSEMILESEEISGENLKNLEKIHNAGMTLLGTVNDVLDISKIESGKFEIIPTVYDTPSLINDTVTLNILRIADKPIIFELHLDENIPQKLFGDELRIKQIFNNLLSNAFKYTREGRVDWHLSSEKDGDSVWIISRVSDTGIGIKPEDIEKLYSDYNQVDTKSNRFIEGTGLGLSITKKIVTMMDGTISVESEYGKGSTFTVRLRQDFIEDNPIGKELAERLKGFRFIDDRRRQNSQIIRIQLPYAKVLVVDDVQTNLDVAKGMMKPYGMQIDCVTNGPDAIDLIRQEETKYNAVFMDHMMPGMDGIEVVRIIREEIGTGYAKNIPIIALTANAITGNEEMFLAHGFQAFLSKPIDIMRLDQVINHWVRDKNLEAALPVMRPQDEEHKTEDGPLIPENTVIEGLDLQNGLERFGGDHESYIKVLKSWTSNTPPLLEQLRVYTPETLPAYAILVHGIKSSCYGISAQTTGAQAEALEHASKAGDFDFVQRNNDTFIRATEKLIVDLSALLLSLETENPKPRKPEPDKKTLTTLLAACKILDIDGIDTAIEDLERFSYDSGADLVEWLRHQINTSGFTEIEERLGKL
ncbi:ATP-binding protein [Treponema primitia]|uniref:ATP-binding protein n=1 Tax=Treponema primitia TaxID=88058 RepID=UPI00397F8EF1